MEDDKVLLKEKCDRILISLIGPNNIEKWWNSTNKGLNNRKPVEVWETDSNKVYRYLLNHLGGEYY